MYTDSRIIVTPNKIYVTQFQKPFEYGYQVKSGSRRKNKKPKKAAAVNFRSVFRSRKQVKLILDSNTESALFIPGGNFRPLFVTLTFADNITEIKIANTEFNKFIKRLNYGLQKELPKIGQFALKYLVAPEIQEKREKKFGFAVWHYHIIFFNFPVLNDTNKLLSEIWKHGFTFNSTISSPEHLNNYVTKYFTKSAFDERLKGKKKYFCSRNLNRPLVLLDKQNNDNIIELLKDPSYKNVYYTDDEPVIYEEYANNPLIEIIYGPLIYKSDLDDYGYNQLRNNEYHQPLFPDA